MSNTTEIMQYFSYAHLPPRLQEVSRPFCELAQHIVATLPDRRERIKALDRLLESKDAAVRAVVAVDQDAGHQHVVKP